MSVPAMVCLSVAIYAALASPFLLLAGVDHLTPACLRRLPLTAAAVLLILGGRR